MSKKSDKKSKKGEKPVKHPILKRTLRYIGYFFVWLFSTLAVLVAGLYIMLMYINKGPSIYVRDLFVSSVMESSAGGILSKIFLSDAEIDEIMSKNSTVSINEITDTTLINVMANNTSDEDWKTIINAYGLTGDNIVHYNLPEQQQRAIEEFLQVDGFPFYRLFDKNGKLYDVDADARHVENMQHFFETVDGK